MFRITRFLALLSVAALAACTISQNVAPVETAGIDVLCVEHNETTHMAEFEPTMVRLIEERGIRTQVYRGERPDDCRHVAIYSANWRWDMAMYLSYFRIEIFDDFKSVAVAEYDAALGGMNLGKFGSTESKIRPLIDRLFPG